MLESTLSSSSSSSSLNVWSGPNKRIIKNYDFPKEKKTFFVSNLRPKSEF